MKSTHWSKADRPTHKFGSIAWLLVMRKMDAYTKETNFIIKKNKN